MTDDDWKRPNITCFKAAEASVIKGDMSNDPNNPHPLGVSQEIEQIIERLSGNDAGNRRFLLCLWVWRGDDAIQRLQAAGIGPIKLFLLRDHFEDCLGLLYQAVLDGSFASALSEECELYPGDLETDLDW